MKTRTVDIEPTWITTLEIMKCNPGNLLNLVDDLKPALMVADHVRHAQKQEGCTGVVFNFDETPRKLFVVKRKMKLELTEKQKDATILAMSVHGSHFYKRLAEAFVYADEKNTARLWEAFPEIAQMFGPGSDYYEGE